MYKCIYFCVSIFILSVVSIFLKHQSKDLGNQTNKRGIFFQLSFKSYPIPWFPIERIQLIRTEKMNCQACLALEIFWHNRTFHLGVLLSPHLFNLFFQENDSIHKVEFYPSTSILRGWSFLRLDTRSESSSDFARIFSYPSPVWWLSSYPLIFWNYISHPLNSVLYPLNPADDFSDALYPVE